MPSPLSSKTLEQSPPPEGRLQRLRAAALGGGLALVVLIGLGLGPTTGWIWAPRPDGRDAPPTRPSTRPPPVAAPASVPTAATAAELRRRLGPDGPVIEDSPFVLAGDVTPARLETLRRCVVRPAAAALGAELLSARPREPIRLIVAGDAEGLRLVARRLFGESLSDSRPGRSSSHYRPASRTLLVDLSAGDGAVVHELTHALLEADFPAAPDWYHEGLASLFEDSRWVEGRLVGRPNWRQTLLAEWVRGHAGPSLAELLVDGRVGVYGSRSGQHYALARSLCLYLQHRGRLVAFHQRFRQEVSRDPLGRETLVAVLGRRDLAEVESDLRAWLAETPLGEPPQPIPLKPSSVPQR